MHVLEEIKTRPPVPCCLISRHTSRAPASLNHAGSSSAYAEAPSRSAATLPFPSLPNLAEALQQFSRESLALDAVIGRCSSSPCSIRCGRFAGDTPSSYSRLRSSVWPSVRHAGSVYIAGLDLAPSGWTGAAIAQHTGLSLRTVRRDLRTTTFTGRTRRAAACTICSMPISPYLLERWNAGAIPPCGFRHLRRGASRELRRGRCLCPPLRQAKARRPAPLCAPALPAVASRRASL